MAARTQNVALLLAVVACLAAGAHACIFARTQRG